MARPRSPSRDKAMRLWLESGKKRMLKDIAKELQVSEEQVRKWKNQDKWDKVTLPNANGNVTKHKGGQPGNRNAVGHGAPKKNSNAEKHGLFRKYLPEEALSIIQEMPDDPLDVLWDQIQIAYAAIIRAQQIMYVRDREDKTIEKVANQAGKVIGEKWDLARKEQMARIKKMEAETERIMNSSSEGEGDDGVEIINDCREKEAGTD